MSTGEQNKSGWIFKSGGKKRTKPGHWQKRWFMLQGGVLAYARKKDGKPVGFIDIDHVSQLQTDASSKGGKFYFNLVTPRRTFFLYCEDAGDRDSWINAVKCNIAYHFSKDPQVSQI